MAQVAIVGTGYVGLVSGACLSDFGNSVICVDTDAAKIARLKNGEIPIYEPGLKELVKRNMEVGRLKFSQTLSAAAAQSDVIFIAVGTPPLPSGGADLSFVEKAAREIGAVSCGYKIVVDKSTVPVGTGRNVKRWLLEEKEKRVRAGTLAEKDLRFDVVSNPEFLREGAAIQDFTHPDRIVIGAESEEARIVMKEVYRSLYLNDVPYIETNIESAEMIKYAANAFLAVKISFINEIANLCEKMNADIQDVTRAMGRDARIGPKFLHPGPGYGGSCFPKDTRAIAGSGREAGVTLSVVEAAIEANERQKTRALEKIEAAFGGALAGKTIAVLGLAFKPNTDDIREAPALSLVRLLAARGAKIRASDPAAIAETKRFFAGTETEKAVAYFEDEYAAIDGADALVIVTEWNQYRNLDLARVKNLLTTPLFFDLRNIYKKHEVECRGFCYAGTGRA